MRWWFAGIGLVVLRFVISSLGALPVWFWLIGVVFLLFELVVSLGVISLLGFSLARMVWWL